jgi:hypothetical protein
MSCIPIQVLKKSTWSQSYQDDISTSDLVEPIKTWLDLLLIYFTKYSFDLKKIIIDLDK